VEAPLSTAIATRSGVPDGRGVFGRRGEDIACAELERRGYIILDRRFRTRRGELDIIARDGQVVVFVEVKARADGSFGTPLEAVSWRKRQRIGQIAAAYLLQKRLGDVSCRFDVVSIVERSGREPAIEIVSSAFDVGG